MNKSVITNRYIIGYVRKYLSPREDKDIRKEDILKNVIANISTGAYNDYKITIMAPTIKESKDYYNIIDKSYINPNILVPTVLCKFIIDCVSKSFKAYKVETNITMDMYMNEFNSNERIKTYSCTHFHCKLRCLDIENGVIHFTTALNELLVTKNIKEFYVNDMCIDINTNTIQKH